MHTDSMILYTNASKGNSDCVVHPICCPVSWLGVQNDPIIAVSYKHDLIVKIILRGNAFLWWPRIM